MAGRAANIKPVMGICPPTFDGFERPATLSKGVNSIYRKGVIMTTQLIFRDTQFVVVNHNQQTCFTAPQLATALAYADQSSVNRIYARHAEEFTACMTASVKLTDPNGDAQDTRIFSLRGAHLIAMFARTPVAKEFRCWVLDILDREMKQQPSVRQMSPAVEMLNIDLLI